jgi:hypothetical protein
VLDLKKKTVGQQITIQSNEITPAECCKYHLVYDQECN